jgi:hypothetical protein
MADHYDDNALIKTLRRCFFSPDGDESANGVYNHYIDQFSRMNETVRRGELLVIDGFLSENAEPTREFAQLFTQRRQLGDLDQKLRRAGR